MDKGGRKARKGDGGFEGAFLVPLLKILFIFIWRGEREGIPSRPPAEHGAQRRAWYYDPEIMTWATKPRATRHPGKAFLWLCLWRVCSHPACSRWNCGNLVNQNQAKPKISSAKKNYITWVFQKQLLLFQNFSLFFISRKETTVWRSNLNQVQPWRQEQRSDGGLHLAPLTQGWHFHYGNISRIKRAWEVSISFIVICSEFRQMWSTE